MSTAEMSSFKLTRLPTPSHVVLPQKSGDRISLNCTFAQRLPLEDNVTWGFAAPGGKRVVTFTMSQESLRDFAVKAITFGQSGSGNGVCNLALGEVDVQGKIHRDFTAVFWTDKDTSTSVVIYPHAREDSSLTPLVVIPLTADQIRDLGICLLIHAESR